MLFNTREKRGGKDLQYFLISNFPVFLSFLAGLALLMRLWGITYGLPCTWTRPDEDRLISTSLRLELNHPDPNYYIWPSLPFYLARPVLETINIISGSELDAPDTYRRHPAIFHLSLRILSALMGAITVLLLGYLGRRLFCPLTGLVAGVFYSFCFLAAREAHFALLDVPLVLILVAAFFFLDSLGKKGTWGSYLVSGLFLGLAVSIKYYGIFLIFPLIVAHLSNRRRCWFRLIVALGLSGLTFVIFNPWLILETAKAWSQIREGIIMSQYWRGFELVPRTVGGRGGIYHLSFSLRYGLGLPLEIIALAGVLLGFFRFRQSLSFRLLLVFLIFFYIALTFQKSCFLRYTMPLLPFLILAGARFLVLVFRRVPGGIKFLPVAVLCLIYEPSSRLVAFDWFISSRPDSRLLVGQWLTRHQPQALLFPSEIIFSRPEGFDSFPRVWRSSPPSRGELDKALRLSGAWLVVDEHSLEYATFSPGASKELTVGLKELCRIDGSAGPGVIFDPFDAFFVPISGFENASRPGPTLAIYSSAPHLASFAPSP